MNLHRDAPLLAATEHRFRALADLSPDAILIHSEGRMVYANQAAVALLRAGGAERIVGLSALEVVVPECRDQVRERIQRLMQGEIVPPREVRWLRFDGTTVEVEVSASPLIDAGGTSIQV
jgi:PAS domain S-box-containing protein